MSDVIAIHLLRETLSRRAKIPAHLVGEGLPERATSNQNASVAGVVYGVWKGSLAREQLTPRDVVRMEALEIWQDGLTAEAVELCERAQSEAQAKAASDEQERSDLAASRALVAAQQEADLLNAAWDMLKYRPPAPEPDPEPETHFADLMLADETIDDAKARLSQRLRELRHYLIAPEIRVNEDGSLGLTSAEQAELQDLERRQTLGRWLEA